MFLGQCEFKLTPFILSSMPVDNRKFASSRRAHASLRKIGSCNPALTPMFYRRITENSMVNLTDHGSAVASKRALYSTTPVKETIKIFPP